MVVHGITIIMMLSTAPIGISSGASRTPFRQHFLYVLEELQKPEGPVYGGTLDNDVRGVVVDALCAALLPLDIPESDKCRKDS